jgi:hypothetical protein
MPIWLLLGIVGLGAYVVGQNTATAAAAAAGATPQLTPPRTYTVGSNGADYYADYTGSSSSSASGTDQTASTDMGTDVVQSSSGLTTIIGTTVVGQIPAGTALTPLDSAQIEVTSNTVSSSSGQYNMQSQQNLSGVGNIFIPVIKVYYNGQYVWVNKNEVF